MLKVKNWYNKLSFLGDREYFDVFDRTSNVLINQIQLAICFYLLFFLITDGIDLNPDFFTTLAIFSVMIAFFFVRNKISFFAAASLQLVLCIIAVSFEFYIHNRGLRVEPLYVVVLLLASLILPNTKSKIFFVALTLLSYLLVIFLTENFELVLQSDLSKEDNLMIFVFAVFMVVLITLRYFYLIKKILSKQKDLLDVLKSKNKELERFAYITSHDLKQPLRNIGSFAGLLRRTVNDPSKNEKKLEYLKEIEGSAGRMNTLIEEILSFSKIDKTEIKKEKVDLGQLVQEFKRSHSELLKERNAKIVSENLPTVTGNKLYLSLLFQNLIGNGIKYNDSKEPTINISSKVNPAKVQLSFLDNGIGISEEFSATIFEPFRRLHSRKSYEGTGLGLSICRKIAETHDGKIWVESQNGKGGTKFIVQLPII